MITLISLADTYLHAPYISHELYELLASHQGGRVALLYNRRGSGRAYICQDCGFFPKCPHCDIAFAYHTSPQRRLLCHQCNAGDHTPMECPHCHGNRFESVGIGIQRIESDIERLFPRHTHFRVDSDMDMKKKDVLRKIQTVDIVLGTYGLIGALMSFDTIVFVQFESDLTLPDYRMEEEVFHVIDYAKRQDKEIYIQTYIPSHPLLQCIQEGNYRDFLQYMSQERKKFLYPPYAEFLTLRIHHTSRERVQSIVAEIVNKIELSKRPTTFLAHDRDIWEKRAGEWIQKIVLKDTYLHDIVSLIQTEVIRNRSIDLERR